jgi:uncharacterized protein (DUF2344 family)
MKQFWVYLKPIEESDYVVEADTKEMAIAKVKRHFIENLQPSDISISTVWEVDPDCYDSVQVDIKSQGD